VEGTTAIVSRFAPGQSDQQAETRATVDGVLRTIFELGGTYPDAIQFLQQASAGRALHGRLAFDALPDELDGRQTIHEEAASRDRDVAPEADEPAGAARPDETP
jgi:hypothetical protein